MRSRNPGLPATLPPRRQPLARVGLALWVLAGATMAAGPSATPAPDRAARPAAGPATPPPPLNGTVRGYDPPLLTVGSPEFGDVRVRIGAGTRIVVNRPASLADIAAGAFIGTTAVEGADGRLRATEVHVFPEALRGTGEGHYPWGGQPATTMTNGSIRTMTNGSVAGASGTATGRVLDVSYAGGQARVEVGPEVPVVVITLADAGALQAGARVLVLGQAGGEGELAADMVAVLPADAPQPRPRQPAH